MRIVIIKLGGSVCTNKGGHEALAPDALRAFSLRIEQLRREYSDSIYILVHGAGSFGHPQVLEYGLRGEVVLTGDVRIRSCLVRNSIQRLHQLVLSDLVTCNVPAVSLSLPGVAYEGCSSHLDTVLHLVACGFVPVLHGDMLASACGTFISAVSGDTIIYKLTESLFAMGHRVRVVFVTDVPGVLSASGELIRRLEFDAPIQKFLRTSNADVTGSMITKVNRARNATPCALDGVFICGTSAFNDDSVCDSEDPANCTRVLPK